VSLPLQISFDHLTMGVLSTLRQDCRAIEYAEKAKAQLEVQLAIDFYGGPEMDKEDEPDKTPKPTDQHRVFDVPLDPKNKDKSDTYEIQVKTFRIGSTPRIGVVYGNK
jgi:hypothetical protein